MSIITNKVGRLIKRRDAAPVARSRSAFILLLALLLGFGLANRTDWQAQAQEQSEPQIITPQSLPDAPPAQRKAGDRHDREPSQQKGLAMMNTLSVTNTNDSGPGSLRQALANALAGDTINLNVTGTITLTSGQLNITKPLTINGPGARLLTVSGNHASRVFFVQPLTSGPVTISGLTVADGFAIGADPQGYGGGIQGLPYSSVNTTLNIESCALTGNHARQGGGITFGFGTLNLSNSTISGNTATSTGGAYIQDSTTMLTNCTLSGNTASSSGGGLANVAAFKPASTMTLANCTIAGNSGLAGAAVFTASHVVTNPPATTQLKNTLVAGNSPRNFLTLLTATTFLNSLGHNLDSDGTSNFSNGANGDIVGTPNAPLNAQLGLLANNGGPTDTRALLCGSPALDAGDNNGAPATDQRGMARPVNGTVDIGAHETAGLLCLGPLANGQAGVSYNQTITTQGCNPPFTFTLAQGNLPPGFALNAMTGVVSGLTTVTGTFNFTVQATTADGCLGERSYTLVIACPAVTVNPLTLPNGTVGAAYNQTLTAAPAGGNYSFAVIAGALPPGLALNGATGAITGAPTMMGAFGVVIRATGFGACSSNQNYSLTINGNACAPITLPNLPNATLGAFYFAQAVASPAGSYSYQLSGTLPPGLSFQPAGALLYGTPAAAGSYSFTITATNASGCVSSRTYSGFQVLTP